MTKNAAILILFIFICQAAGVIGSVFTARSIPDWYAGLVKPSFNPPNWIFGPVWITLYFLMGISAFLVWKEGSLADSRTKTALMVFLIHLVLNVAWSVIFFGLQAPGWAFLDILGLWLMILLTIILFAGLSKPAAVLLIPYILWVSFAAVLNYSLWKLNP